jgi:hypothetical protein
MMYYELIFRLLRVAEQDLRDQIILAQQENEPRRLYRNAGDFIYTLALDQGVLKVHMPSLRFMHSVKNPPEIHMNSIRTALNIAEYDKVPWLVRRTISHAVFWFDPVSKVTLRKNFNVSVFKITELQNLKMFCISNECLSKWIKG